MKILDIFNKEKSIIKQTEFLIHDLKNRGFNSRDRLFRKLVEELGEYAEAIEYNNGSTRKKAKFKNKATPKQKLQEEIVDIFMVTIALAYIEDLSIIEMLKKIIDKLGERKKEHDNRVRV